MDTSYGPCALDSLGLGMISIIKWYIKLPPLGGELIASSHATNTVNTKAFQLTLLFSSLYPHPSCMLCAICDFDLRISHARKLLPAALASVSFGSGPKPKGVGIRMPTGKQITQDNQY